MMDTSQLVKYGPAVKLIVGTGTRDDVQQAVEQLVADESWDVCGIVLASAAELGARLLVAELIKRQVYAPLAYAACMRRQIKQVAHQVRPGQTARRVFRDFDTETETKAVPDHIKAEMDDLQAQAEESRFIADRRDAERDACPIRALIVAELGNAMTGFSEAVGALIAIVLASAWEDTARSAALKLLTHPNTLPRLVEAGRIDDMVTIANACGLDSAGEKVAELLGGQVDDLIANRKRGAVRLIGRYHSDPAVREKAVAAFR